MTPEAALEAVLFVAEGPVSTERLSATLAITPVEAEAHLKVLADRLESPHRGLRLERVAGGWRLYTHPDLWPYVENFASCRPIDRLSLPAQEVLAVIAYRQPVSKAQINEIRGVDSSSPLRTLEKIGLIEAVARLRVAGRPVLYGTTEALLEVLGLDSLDDLPSLSDLVPTSEVVDGLVASAPGG